MVSRPTPIRITLPQHPDERGILVVCEGNLNVPFEIKRAFWIHAAPYNAIRAKHAHKTCAQLIIAVNGTFDIYSSGIDRTHLDDPHVGYYIPAGMFIEITNFSQDAVCLVLASEHYSEEDYERQNSKVL